jgi:AraC-like DNA-binding protein
LEALAKRASLSPYHFLRVFKTVAGISPHQFILRARMRAAARRLSLSDESVTTVALACGFSDLANFTRGFRAEFGRPPGAFRR